MLLQRVLTALILVPVVVAVILLQNTIVFFLVVYLLIMLLADELAGLLEIAPHQDIPVFKRLLQLLFPVFYYRSFKLFFKSSPPQDQPITEEQSTAFEYAGLWQMFFMALTLVSFLMPYSVTFFLLITALWTLVTFFMYAAPQQLLDLHLPRFVRAMVGVLQILPFPYALSVIWFQPNGHYALLFLLGLIWVADISAYFAGRQFGRRKLSPLLSPGKSIEGALAAVLCSFLFAFFASFYLFEGNIQRLLLILVSPIVVLFSISGDLFESLEKRRIGVKDSGTLFPGHGGICDRLDSLLSATPLFALLLVTIGRH